MNKINSISIISLILMLVFGMGTKAANIVYSDPQECPVNGNIAIPLKMDNDKEVVAVEFDVALPSALSAVLDGTNWMQKGERLQDHAVVTKKMSSTYKVVIYSISSKTIRGNKGVFLYMPVAMRDGITVGTKFNINLSNITIVDKDGNNLADSEEATIEVTAAEPNSPDVTVTEISTSVTSITPGDAFSIAYQVINQGNLPLANGWKEDVALVAPTGEETFLGTFHHQGNLTAGAQEARNETFNLQSIPGIEGSVAVRVKVTPYANSGEHDSRVANNTVISTATMNVGKQLTLTLPTSIDENDTGLKKCVLTRSGFTALEESFNLTFSDPSRLTLSGEVTFPAGSSSVTFYISAKDDEIVNVSNDVTVRIASAHGYNAVQGTVTINDNDNSQLTATATATDVAEGGKFNITVSSNRPVKTEPLEVKVACDQSARLIFPSTITIPAGQNSVTMEVEAIDDDVPQVETATLFTFTAMRHDAAELPIVLLDNDMPELEMILQPTTVSEGAGVNAITAKLVRKTNTDKAVTIKLSDDSKGDIYYSRNSITMPKGVDEVEFTLGVIDNTQKEGDREVVITAAVHVESCNCSSQQVGIGLVSQTLTIIDNDGPSLTLTSSSSSILEGNAQGVSLTISRNTDTSQALIVSLSSDRDDELEYEHNVAIPAGAAEVSIKVTAPLNEQSDDNRTTVFTATADGFATATTWVMITDQSLPDAVMGNLSLEKTSLVAKESNTVNLTVKNIGNSPLPQATKVLLKVDGKTDVELYTDRILQPGEQTALTKELKTPSTVGRHTYIATVNDARTSKELFYTNNSSQQVVVEVMAPYSVKVEADRTMCMPGDSVTLSGQVMTDAPAFSEVELFYYLRGYRSSMTLTTDVDGRFSQKLAINVPSRISVGACYPGENLTDTQCNIDVMGMRCSPNSQQLTIYPNELLQGNVRVENPTGVTLTNVHLVAENSLEEVTFTGGTLASIAGESVAAVPFSLLSSRLTDGNFYEQLKLRVECDQDAEANMTVFFFCTAHTANLQATPTSITTTMTKGQSHDYMFDILNAGMGETGKITLSLPSGGWMKAVTPNTIGSLQPGETATVVLRLQPVDDMPLNLPVTGNIGVNCTNGNGLSLPFRITPVSTAIGSLTIDVCDEFTYYTDEHPHVEGAKVTIRDISTNMVVYEGLTGADGIYHLDAIAEGYYSLTVGSTHHDTYTNNILIDPETETSMVVNLGYQAVEVNWSVVESDVEDVYDIVTEVTYETHVPVPVVVVDMPTSIDAGSLAPGESLVFYATMTNKGLITAHDCQLTMPTGFKVLKFSPLIDGTFDLTPQQSVTVPIKVENTYNPGTNRRSPTLRMDENGNALDGGFEAGGGASGGGSEAWSNGLADEPCQATPSLSFWWDCGRDHKWHEYRKPIRVKYCKSTDNGIAGGFGLGNGWGADTSGGKGGNETSRPWSDNKKNVKGEYQTSGNPSTKQEDVGSCSVPCIMGYISAVWNAVWIATKYIPATAGFRKAYDALTKGFKAGIKIIDAGEELIADLKAFADGNGDWLEMGKDLNSLGGNVYDLYDNYGKFHEEVDKEVLETLHEDWVHEHQDDYDDALNDRLRQEDLQYREDMTNLDAYLFTKYAGDIQTNGRSSLRMTDEFESGGGGSNAQSDESAGIDNVHIKSPRRENWEAFYDAYKGTIKQSGNVQKSGKVLASITDSELLGEWADAGKNALKPFKVIQDILDAINGFVHACDKVDEWEVVDKDKPSSAPTRRPQRRTASAPLPSFITDMEQKGKEAMEYYQTRLSFHQLILGDSPEWLDVSFYDLERFFDALEWRTYTLDELQWWRPECMSEATLEAFVERYNNRVAGGDLDNLQLANDYLTAIANMHNKVVDLGAANVNDWITENILDNMAQSMGLVSETVCASITLKFEQQMVLTRQAFLGTLEIYNGNETDAMTDMKLDLVVIDPDGNVATSHEFQINNESADNFGIQKDGSWTLGSKQTGIATYRFIPTKYAAPEDTVYYSFGGTLSYVDPFNGMTVKRTLNPVTLAVCPSPDLELTYFMQRDVLGDNTLTPDVIEPSEEAEFSLLLRNIGQGLAKNVRFSTKQPEIVDNEKGLLIDFEIESSQVNGQDKTLALGETIVNNLGNIEAGGHSVVQWWLKSSLLGHFTKYNVSYTHLTSFDNPDLSLISSVSIKELIRSVRDDKDDFAFLTNDTPDSDDMADHIYKTDGHDYDVLTSVANEMVDNGDDTYTLTVHPQIAGNWIYGNLTDPTLGKQTIKSVTRISDGREIDVRNFWQTFITLRDGKDPLEENLIHFVDSVNSVSESYLITFEDKAETTLEVESIVADQNTEEVLKTAVSTVTVTFNKPVVEEDVNASCLTLLWQGKKVDIEDIDITKVNETTYVFDVTPYTYKNGYYVFTIQTADIHDQEGFTGKTGKQLAWTQQKDLKKVVLDELSTEAPIAEEEVEVTVKRTLKTGEWNTLVLPFSMNSVQVKSEFGDDVLLMDFTGYDVTKNENNRVETIDVNFSQVEAIEANHPYLIAVSRPFSQFNAYAVDIEPVEVPKVATVTRTSTVWSEFIGTYVAETIVPNNMLFLNSNLFYYSTGNTKMKAFRGYFDFSDIIEDMIDADVKVRIHIDGEITDIKVVDERRLTEGVYTLQGVYIGKNVDSSKLPKGIYIVDGKKVYVK